MNDRAGGRWRWCRAWPRQAGVLAGAGILLLAAACSSGSSASAGSPLNPGSSSSTGGSSAAQQELAYAQCMRSHGVANFPDPNPQGGFGDTTQVQSNPNYASADSTCKSLLPNGGTGKGTQDESQLLQLAQCMRSHGVPNYPDPNPNPTVNPRIALAQAGIDVNSPQFQSASQTCERLYPLPSRSPSPGSGS